MFFGRVLGWSLVGLAGIMASLDAVMALGPRDYVFIATADVFTLLSGRSVQGLGGVAAQLLEMPAWAVVGGVGTLMCFFFRKRRRHVRHFQRRRPL